MNACALEFGDGSFDCVLDKGTMDSILCGEGSINNVGNLCMEVSRCAFLGVLFRFVFLGGGCRAWLSLSVWKEGGRAGTIVRPIRSPTNPLLTHHYPPTPHKHTYVCRVLKPNGVFLVVSYGVPDNRLQYLQEETYKWRVTIHTVRECLLRESPRSLFPAEFDTSIPDPLLPQPPITHNPNPNTNQQPSPPLLPPRASPPPRTPRTPTPCTTSMSARRGSTRRRRRRRLRRLIRLSPVRGMGMVGGRRRGAWWWKGPGRGRGWRGWRGRQGRGRRRGKGLGEIRK